MINWYKKQPITIKGAIIGGLFAILAAIITILPDILIHPVTVVTETNTNTPITLLEPSLASSTPTPTSTLTETPTSLPTLTDTPSTTPTLTPVPILTFTPTVDYQISRGIEKNCIDKKYWYPKPVYSSDKLTQDKNGCWNLSSWGIFAENQALKFIIQDDEFNENISRSIYTFIDDKATIIQFKVRVEALTSASNLYGSLFIGLGNKANFTKPGFFVGFTAPLGENKTFLETSSEYYLKYWEPRIDYTLGEVLIIKIVIMNPYVSIRVDGNEIRGLNLDAANREVLWIGYTTHPTNNHIIAEIFDFSISEK